MWIGVGNFTLTQDWTFSEPVVGDFFRLRWANMSIGQPIMICQAQFSPSPAIASNQPIQVAELGDVRLIEAKADYEILLFLKPELFQQRRIGFKKVVKKPTLENDLRRILNSNLFKSAVTSSSAKTNAGSVHLEVNDIAASNTFFISATNSEEGKVKLAKDLGGTSSNPIVAGIQGKRISNAAPLDKQVLSWDDAAKLWTPVDLAISSSSVAFAREVVELSTAELNPGASEIRFVSLGKLFNLLHTATSSPAWVRIYSDQVSAKSDMSRSQNEDAGDGIGLIAEIITSPEFLAIKLSPIAVGANTDIPPIPQIPVSISNLGPSPATIQVSLTKVSF